MALSTSPQGSSENQNTALNESLAALCQDIDILEFNQQFEAWVDYFFEHQKLTGEPSGRKYRKKLKNALESYLDFFATGLWKDASERELKAKHELGRKYRQILFGAKSSPYSIEEGIRLQQFVGSTRSRVNELLSKKSA